MKAKRILTFILSLIMLLSCTVSLAETPETEEPLESDTELSVIMDEEIEIVQAETLLGAAPEEAPDDDGDLPDEDEDTPDEDDSDLPEDEDLTEDEDIPEDEADPADEPEEPADEPIDEPISPMTPAEEPSEESED